MSNVNAQIFEPLPFLAAGVSFLPDLAGLALVAGRPREALLGLPVLPMLPDS